MAHNVNKIAALLVLAASITGAQAQLSLWSGEQVVTPAGTVPGTSDSDTIPLTLGPVSTTRTLTQTVVSGTNPASYSAEIVSNFLYLSEGVGDASRVEILWGASGADMNLDLSAYGDAFAFEYIFGDGSAIGTEIVATLWNGATSYTAPVITLLTTSPGEPGIPFTIPFASFGAADFAGVDRMSFTVTLPTSADVTLSDFRVVPEPSGLGLLGFAGLLLRRKR